jgi:hypothetical protein
MIKCPMCREILSDDVRQCRKCQTDLSLLSDYTSHLRAGLTQAESCTRAGELGDAVWAYLAVLEVDPDNASARRQVGKVVTAVRQFDQTAPGRRWARALQKETRYRRWVASVQEGESGLSGLLSWVILFLMFSGSVIGAYYLGVYNGKQMAVKEMPPAETRRTRPIEADRIAEREAAALNRDRR